ncbi:unnamed protein product [Plutella xylostella]|uniref:(diamondback moth) hypothetical protein n=1 Tax=Plutella xylostella TaxID=51655 RepID=A0A8S4GGZ3_PLUXY|nr:unnamed protein product [Plutella xylostella]
MASDITGEAGCPDDIKPAAAAPFVVDIRAPQNTSDVTVPMACRSDLTETLESLEDLPNVLDKYWTTISDSRIADLIRQICSLVESPRTQVARTACTTLSVLLQNTKYTKKPDFYEAISILLVKTGSFCRPVRRAANVALDRVACAADLAHTVTAICAHGIDFCRPVRRAANVALDKVACAADLAHTVTAICAHGIERFRALEANVALDRVACAADLAHTPQEPPSPVCSSTTPRGVSGAVGRAGRELLRCRPALAATARRHALQALARLLEDKNQETRKYAERLYGMLRPLANFEAFYLTDVTLETAAAQMKKHDRLLTAQAGHESR